MGKRKNKNTFQRSQNINAVLFLLPCGLGFLVFIIYPLVASFVFCFIDWNDFYKQKIVWTPVNSEYRFAFVEGGIFFNNSLFMMTGEHLKYLLSLFNSKLFIFYLDKILANGNYAYGSGITFKNISVPKPDVATEQKIKALLKTQSYQEIDELIYTLYGLAKAEIQLIET
jgi:ABC-type sugar transport system permease subunit